MAIEIKYQTKQEFKKYQLTSKVKIENVTYELDESEPVRHGGNSFVLKAYREYDTKTEYAIKFMLQGKKNERKLIKKINDAYQKSDSFIRIIAEDRVEFSEFSYSNMSDYRSDENAKKLTIDKTCYVMPYTSINLREYMCDNEVSFNDIKYYLLQLAKGLAELHKLNIKHLDIKPDNLLFGNGNFIYADFGSATTSAQCKTSDCSNTWPIPEYIEPCIDMRSTKIDAKKTDIFELGCIFYYLITKQFPIGYQTKGLDKLQVDRVLIKIIEEMLEYNQSSRLNDGEELYKRIAEYVGSSKKERQFNSTKHNILEVYNCMKRVFKFT